MTAVPGAPAPRRLLLSSSPRRGARGPFAALAFIAVGLRLMGTLRVRTWHLWGAKTADHRSFIIGTSPPRFQIVIFPRFVGNSDAFRFAEPVPARGLPVQSTDSNADNSGQFRRKPADFSRDVASRMRSQPVGTECRLFVTPPPAISGRGLCEGAALPPAREQASC